MFIYGHWRTALIQEQGHPNQVLSLETHPICTSLHIHSHSLSVSRPQSPPALGSLRDSETHWCWSPVQLGLWTEGDIPPGRSPVPPARSQPSRAVLGVCAQCPQAAARAAPGRGSALPAGSGSRLSLGLLLAAHVWFYRWAINPQGEAATTSPSTDPPRESRPRPQIFALVSPLVKAPAVFFSRYSEHSAQRMPLLIASAGLQMQLILGGGRNPLLGQ